MKKEPEKMERTNTTLPKSLKDKARKIGAGCVSAGIRVALKAYKQK